MCVREFPGKDAFLAYGSFLFPLLWDEDEANREGLGGRKRKEGNEREIEREREREREILRERKNDSCWPQKRPKSFIFLVSHIGVHFQ